MNNNAAVFLCPYPTGLFTGRYHDGRFLCVITPEKSHQIDIRKAVNAPFCMWLCEFPDDLMGREILYVNMSDKFPYCVSVSDKTSNSDGEYMITKGLSH